MFLVRVFSILMLLCGVASAQSNPGFIDGKPLCATYPNINCPAPANPLSLNQAFMAKQDYPNVNGVVPNCVGNGIADDTVCMQTAINLAVSSGVPLYVGLNNKIYLISSPLTSSGVVQIEGFAPVGNDGVSNAQTCLNGITVGSNNIDALQLNGPKSIVRNVCFQMGSTSNRRSAGAAIVLGGTDQGHSLIIGNTIFWPYDGIQIGRGSSDLVRASNISNNVIRSPIRYGIANGMGTTGGATAGNTFIDNQIGCDSGVTGTGFAFFDGAVVVDGTTNGPNNCSYGTAIIPGNGQNVNGEFRGVMGDSDTVNDLLIAPVETGGILFGGVVDFLDFTQAWAAAVGNHTSVLVNCPANTLCEEIRFNSLTAHGGLNQTAPIVDIERGAGGPINLQLSNSTICSFRTAGGGEIALKLNVAVAQTAHWVVADNKIGQACDGGGGGSPTPIGISLSFAGAAGDVIITGNDVSQSATPLVYTPNGENVILDANLGIPNSCTSCASGGVLFNNSGVLKTDTSLTYAGNGGELFFSGPTFSIGASSPLVSSGYSYITLNGSNGGGIDLQSGGIDIARFVAFPGNNFAIITVADFTNISFRSDAGVGIMGGIYNHDGTWWIGGVFTPLGHAGLYVNSGTLTGSDGAPVVDIQTTWNTSGAPAAILANVVNTASNAASKLIDLQVSGASKFNVSPAGAVVAVGLPTSAGGGGLSVCVDTSGVFYKKATCP